MFKRKTTEDIILDPIICLFLIAILFITIYPFYYVLIISFNQGIDASLGGIYWFSRKFTLENYKDFFTDDKWVSGLVVSILTTIAGTAVGVFFTTLVSYGMSFKDLAFRKFYMALIIISMYFSGGIIPYYMLLRSLHLLNSFWVYVVPGALNTFFLIIGISFFSGIPASLRESARMDGANELTIFAKIILPISKPFVATLVLFNGVGHWNDWFTSAFFVRNKNLRTLSYLMMEIINRNMQSIASSSGVAVQNTAKTSLSIQMAAMIISVAPIICIYPFLQKYFVKGIMLGSVKE